MEERTKVIDIEQFRMERAIVRDGQRPGKAVVIACRIDERRRIAS
jgi:hypothetical protein